MEFFLELLLSFFLEGSIEIIQEKQIPRWIRIIVLIIITIFYSAFTSFLIYLSVKGNSLLFQCITAMIAILFLALFGRFWYKIAKEYRKNK